MDVTDVSTIIILAPFFAIICSLLSTSPIIAAVLLALYHFFTCGLISSNLILLKAASLIKLSSMVSHCKFEASDFSGDEVVLLKIMAVIQVCLCSNVGKGLGDIEVCKMLETMLTTCCQMCLSGELKCFFMQTHSFLAQRHFTNLQNTQCMPWSEPCSPDYIP